MSKLSKIKSSKRLSYEEYEEFISGKKKTLSRKKERKQKVSQRETSEVL